MIATAAPKPGHPARTLRLDGTPWRADRVCDEFEPSTGWARSADSPRRAWQFPAHLQRRQHRLTREPLRVREDDQPTAFEEARAAIGGASDRFLVADG
jgi:hypothetical protein